MLASIIQIGAGAILLWSAVSIGYKMGRADEWTQHRLSCSCFRCWQWRGGFGLNGARDERKANDNTGA